MSHALSPPLSLSSESNRGRHAKMTGVEKERDRGRGNNRTESSPRSAAVIIHPVLPLSPTSAAAGIQWGRRSRAERSTENHIYQERARERGCGGEPRIGRRGRRESRIHLSSLLAAVAVEREREEKESTSPLHSVVGRWIVCRCGKRRVYTRNLKRKHNRKG